MIFYSLCRIDSGSTSTPGSQIFGVLVLVSCGAYSLYSILRRNKSMKLYEDAYSAFVSNPLDPVIREAARDCANIYADSMLLTVSGRQNQKSAMNREIDHVSRCAKAQEKLRQDLNAHKATNDVDRLAALQKMFDQGLISEQEFQSKRTQILDEV